MKRTMKQLQKYLSSNKPGSPGALKNSFSLNPITFGKVTVSMQAGKFLYSTPRDDVGPWTKVELGFPKGKVPDYIKEYKEMPKDKDSDSVYPYVPIELVVRWIHEETKAHCTSVLFIEGRTLPDCLFKIKEFRDE